MDDPLPIERAKLRAIRILQQMGYMVPVDARGLGRPGVSTYLHKAHSPYSIRVSDHAVRLVAQYPNVTGMVTIDRPMTNREIRALCREAYDKDRAARALIGATKPRAPRARRQEAADAPSI